MCNDRQLTSTHDYIDDMPNNNDSYLETQDGEPSKRASTYVGDKIRKTLFQYWLGNVK
jgi:hypothetical protein